MNNLERYTTYTRSITLAEMLKVAELDLPMIDGVAKSRDWLPRVSSLAFGWQHGSNNRKTCWLLNFMVQLADQLKLNGKKLSAIVKFEDRDRIYLYNATARKYTLAIAMLVRKELGQQQLTKAVKAKLIERITTDAVTALYKDDHRIELTYTTPLHLSQSIFDRKMTACYDEAIAHITWLIGKKPSRTFVYKHFPKAKSRHFTQTDCEFLADRLQST